MTPHELETLRPFILPIVILIAFTALCVVASIGVALYGIRKERRTWRLSALFGSLQGLFVISYLATSGVAEYAASRLGYEAEWTASVFIQYAIELAILLVAGYLSVKHLRLAFKGRALEKMLSDNK